MSLLFPAYLLGLFGLALPWILHRFSDQHPPVQLFPSREFLEPTTPPVSRKRTLRYRALLALRVLALLLLCLLFTQPWININGAAISQEKHHMIVIDQSLSMRAEGRWASAQSQAQDIIAELADASVQLIGFDRSVSVLGASGQSENGSDASLSSIVDDIQPGYAPADYGLLMQRLDRLAAEEELPVKVWLISDRQQSALPAQLNALYAPDVSELEFVPVTTDESVNVHLIATAESSNDATATVTVSLLASDSTGQSGSLPIERTLRLEAAGEVLEQSTVSLIPGELFVASFADQVLPAQSNPEFTVSLLEPDALADDNRLRLPISRQLPTGVVLLSAAGERTGSSSVFLSTALETEGMSRVEAIRGSTLQIAPDTPNLVTGRDLSEPVDQDVLQFVDTGGNALVFNNTVTRAGADAPLEGVGVGVIDEAHPLALGDISWIGTEFYDLPAMAQSEDDRVLLQTSDGQNVLLERSTNRGRLLILNDPLDGLASNLPLQPAFVSLMQSLLRYFDASTSVPTQVVIGERLALPANVQLIDSAGDALLQLSDTARASTIELENPGIYTVVSARGEQSLRAVLDAQEADLSTLSPEAIDAWQARYDDSGDEQDISDAGLTDIALPSVSNDTARQGLWLWLLPVTAMLFLAEGWFANRRLDVRRDGS